jgi:hypothetical protein
MKNYIKILSLLLFIVTLWVFSFNLESRINTDLYNLRQLQKELFLKESFDKQNSPSKLYNSINEFVPEKLDKTKLTDSIVKFSKESGISIKNIDIKESRSEILNQDGLSYDESSKISNFDTDSVNISTLKSIDLNIKFMGDKKSIDSFLSKLVQSKQFIDIHNISIKYNNNNNNNNFRQSAGQMDGSVIAKLYYINI